MLNWTLDVGFLWLWSHLAINLEAAKNTHCFSDSSVGDKSQKGSHQTRAWPCRQAAFPPGGSRGLRKFTKGKLANTQSQSGGAGKGAGAPLLLVLAAPKGGGGLTLQGPHTAQGPSVTHLATVRDTIITPPGRSQCTAHSRFTPTDV